MRDIPPLATYEVRWFFTGPVREYPALRRWFETAVPVAQNPDVGPPQWQERLGGEPDIYLLVPHGTDMGIKWREGQLQIKGQVTSCGLQRFGEGHQGQVERWVKWSYAHIPAAYQQLFANGEKYGLQTIAVHKIRATRKIELDTLTGRAQEVTESTSFSRGLSVELADIEAAGKAYCSLAFEAFPDDAAMSAAFTQVVTAFLAELTEFPLSAAHSLSYPAWLLSLTSAP